MRDAVALLVVLALTAFAIAAARSCAEAHAECERVCYPEPAMFVAAGECVCDTTKELRERNTQ